MALKDWKKSQVFGSEIGWRNNKSGRIIISKGFKGYRVYIDTETDDYITDWFKTKSQALGYAKQYMRNH